MVKFFLTLTASKVRARILNLASLLLLLAVCACNPIIEEGVNKSDLRKDVELITDYGSIILRLSDETPKHRNNFIKLVNQGFLDSLEFYRVINNFLIQTGKDVSSDLPALIDAEIQPNLFHKRGAVNAARAGDDQNPEQGSANLHFTIIQGKVLTDSMINASEKRLNKWLAYNRLIHKPEGKSIFEKLQLYMIIEQHANLDTSETKSKEDLLAYNKVIKNPENMELFNKLKEITNPEEIRDSINLLKDKLNLLAEEEFITMEPYRIPEAHRQVYKTIGGAPHLDINYTVFGEVVKGMDIVDKIAAVETNRQEKPLKEVRIIKAKLIKRKNYN